LKFFGFKISREHQQAPLWN